MISYIPIHLFITHGFITNPQDDQLACGLLAQLLEHRTGITEVMVRLPYKPEFF